MSITFNQAYQSYQIEHLLVNRVPDTATGKVLGASKNICPKLFIPKDILIIFIRYLNDQTLSNLEQTEKAFLESDFTSHEWELRKKEAYRDFKFGGCKNERQRAKCEYFIAKIIDEFVLKYVPPDSIEVVISKKYCPTWLRHPFLEKFFKIPLNMKISEAAEQAFEIALSENEAGELMLKGLLLSTNELNPNDHKEMLLLFSKAIKKNATCLSLYSKYFTNPQNRFQIALQAAKLGDEQDLFNFLASTENFAGWVNTISMKERESIFSILFLLSIRLSEEVILDIGEELLKRTLSLKRPLTPISLLAAEDLIRYAIYKFENRLDLKEIMLNIALEISDKNISNNLVLDSIYNKIFLSQSPEIMSEDQTSLIREAKNLFLYRISSPSNESRPEDLITIASLLILFLNPKDAELILLKTIDVYGADAPASTFLEMGIIQLKLNDLYNAKIFYEKAKEAYGKNVPTAVLNELIKIQGIYERIKDTKYRSESHYNRAQALVCSLLLKKSR